MSGAASQSALTAVSTVPASTARAGGSGRTPLRDREQLDAVAELLGIRDVGRLQLDDALDVRLGELHREVADAAGKAGPLIGSGPEVLRNIDVVGNDFNMGSPGTCGKDGQGVPVGDGQPTLRVP